MQISQSRRRVLAGLSLTGATALIGVPRSLHAEPPPETTAVRLPVFYKISDCMSPEYISTDLLRAEGFTDIEFVDSGTGGPDSSDWLANGELDFDWNYPAMNLRSLAAGAPITVLAGMHGGCLELIADISIRDVTDLKGKRVGIDINNGSPHLLLLMAFAYVGLDPRKDINWIANPDVSPLELLAEGKIDASLVWPPLPQEARDRKIGHTILDMTVDRPWSSYFCCTLAGTKDYVSRYPVATKRVMRALLKSIDLCASDPERVAKLAVERGFARRYEYTIQALRQVRYDAWREFDNEDSMLFYGLRMQETGLLNTDFKKLIAAGTDWRFIEELKRELKT